MGILHRWLQVEVQFRKQVAGSDSNPTSPGPCR